MVKRFDMEVEHGWVTARSRKDGKWVRYTDYAALEAQLAARTGGVKVKPLEWVQTCGSYRAKTPFGTETVYAVAYEGNCGGTAYAIWGEEEFQSADDAKAAAQADYERRILSALEPAAPGTDKPTLYETLLMDAGASPEGARRLQRGEPAWAAGAKAQIRETHASIYTRPSEQAVTEAARAVLAEAEKMTMTMRRRAIFNALKAAMEARHD